MTPAEEACTLVYSWARFGSVPDFDELTEGLLRGLRFTNDDPGLHEMVRQLLVGVWCATEPDQRAAEMVARLRDSMKNLTKNTARTP